MDLATIFGIGAGFFLVIYSILIGGDLNAFIDIPSVMIVIGGTSAAAFINYPMDEILSLPAVVKNAFFGRLSSPEIIITKIVKLAETARRDGILAMENELASIEDNYLKKGLQLVIDGTREESVTSIMEAELTNSDERHKVGIEILITMAGFAPAFGMLGTLIGLVQMLQTLDDPSKIGAGMAVALITSFYGSVLANLLFLPLAGKLKRRSQLEAQSMELILTGVMGILNGENPRMIKDTLLTFVKPKLRAKMIEKK